MSNEFKIGNYGWWECATGTGLIFAVRETEVRVCSSFCREVHYRVVKINDMMGVNFELYRSQSPFELAVCSNPLNQKLLNEYLKSQWIYNEFLSFRWLWGIPENYKILPWELVGSLEDEINLVTELNNKITERLKDSINREVDLSTYNFKFIGKDEWAK